MVHLIQGSAMHRNGARHITKTDENHVIRATISIRRRLGHDPIPTFDEFVGCPERPRLTADEFASRYGASTEDVNSIFDFCAGHGIKIRDHHMGRRHVRVEGTVGQFNQAFGIDTQTYEIDDDYHGTYQFRAHDHLSVPGHLKDVVHFVHGIGDGLRPRPTMALNPPVLQTFTPNQVASIYQFLGNTAVNQTIGIWGWGLVASDYPTTLNNWGITNIPPITDIFVDGSTNPGAAGAPGEAVLDASLCAAFGPGTKLVNYYPNGNVSSYWVDTVGRMVHPLAGDPVCNILSFSFIFTENVEIANSAFIQSSDSLFEDAAILGITVLASTGDAGSTNYSTIGGTAGVFIGYPCGSPWVTAVGGTTLGAASGTIGPTNFEEWVWDSGTGGGISEAFPVPSYQKGYTLPVSLRSGNAGRGIPDLAGNASQFSPYRLTVNGVAADVGDGTSATCPMYAGSIALINTYLGRNVGFLNPTLYACGSGTLPATSIITAVGQTFTDAQNNVWGLANSTNGLQITLNGVVDGTTSNVIKLMLYRLTGTVYQENNALNWFSKATANSAWAAVTGDPTVKTGALVAIRDIDGASGGAQNNGVTTPQVTPGYPVGIGWDACTGLGVLNGVQFAYYLASTPVVTLLIGITLTATTVSAGVASGTVIGTASVQTVGPPFTGTLTVSGTNASQFQFIGKNLCTLGNIAQGTYTINLVATQAGSTGSPFAQSSVTITATQIASYTGAKAPNSQFWLLRDDGLGAGQSVANAYLTLPTGKLYWDWLFYQSPVVFVTPGPVSNIVKTTATPTSVTVSWAAPTTGQSPFTYHVFYSLTATGPWTQVGGTVTNTNFTVTGLGELPGPVSGITGSNITGSSVTIAWNAETGLPQNYWFSVVAIGPDDLLSGPTTIAGPFTTT